MFHKILPKIQPNLNLEQKTKTGFVLGIIGMVAWFIPILGLPIQIIGLTFSIKGLESSKKRLAKIGLVLSIIGLVFTIANASIGAYTGATGQNPFVNKILGE